MTAPAVLSFSNNSAATIEFFDKLKQGVFTNRTFKVRGKIYRKRLSIELKGIERISLPCAVILSAELKRWSSHIGQVPSLQDFVKCSDRVKSLLIDLGTLSHLGISKKSYKRDRQLKSEEQITLLPLTSANWQNAKKIYKLNEQLHEVFSKFSAKHFHHRAMLEATNNVIDHAYDESLPLKYAGQPGKQWYATGSYDPSKKALRFFVYDQGAGIPSSLLNKPDWRRALEDVLGSLFGVQHDADIIEAAFEIGRSRTGLAERGKGLRDIRNVLDQTGSGYLRIISGKGDYLETADHVVQKRSHGSHIGGTLVEWSLPVSALSGEKT